MARYSQLVLFFRVVSRTRALFRAFHAESSQEIALQLIENMNQVRSCVVERLSEIAVDLLPSDYSPLFRVGSVVRSTFTSEEVCLGQCDQRLN